ncbi:MAG: transglycosylase domain-containing protein [Acidiferrobacter sp.]
MRPRRLLGLAILILSLFVAGDLTVLAWRWLSIPHLAQGPVPMSRFVRAYRRREHGHPQPPLRWQPVTLAAIPRPLRQAVILGEDGSFYTNDGFDLPAIWAAARYDWRAGRIIYGASTLTQQTAKNMFLDPARTFFRKANEALLTIALTHALSKNRILELYLDNAQFGRGVYGVQAAAEYYFGQPVGTLDPREDAELAATLPDPLGSNPATDSGYFRRRTAKIRGLLAITAHALTPGAQPRPTRPHGPAVAVPTTAVPRPRIAAMPARLYSDPHHGSGSTGLVAPASP